MLQWWYSYFFQILARVTPVVCQVFTLVCNGLFVSLKKKTQDYKMRQLKRDSKKYNILFFQRSLLRAHAHAKNVKNARWNIDTRQNSGSDTWTLRFWFKIILLCNIILFYFHHSYYYTFQQTSMTSESFPFAHRAYNYNMFYLII